MYYLLNADAVTGDQAGAVMYGAKRLNGEAVGLYFQALQDCRNRIVAVPPLRIVEVIAEYAGGRLVLESEVVREYNFDGTPK